MRLVFILLAVMTFFFSCKKKETIEPVIPNTTATNNYYGVLSSYLFNALQAGTLTNYQGMSNATFSSNAMINNGVVNNSYLDAGNITLNGIVFKKRSPILYYSDTTYTAHALPNSWAVSGQGNVPAFTFSNTNSYPAYNGYSTLTDTIKLGQSNTISLSGISGANQIQIYLYDYPQSHTSTIKYVSGSSTSVTFSPNEINTLTSTNTGFLTVISIKDTFQTFGGKQYKFEVGYQLQKLNMVFN